MVSKTNPSTTLLASSPPPNSPRHRDPSCQPKKPILRRTKSSDYKRPLPRFENDPATKKADQRDRIGKRSRYPQPPAKSLPAIFAQLEEQYSPELIRRVPPNIMPYLLGRSAHLAEPYEVTLKRAARRGDIPTLHVRKASPPRPAAALTPEPVATRSSRVAFGDVKVMK